MRRTVEHRGASIIMIDYLSEPPDPEPRPLNGYYFRSAGYDVKGSTYTKNGITVAYDGCYWTCNGQRIETIEELEKMIDEPTAK